MLDFYLISDSERSKLGEEPDPLSYVGSLALNRYTRLVKKGVIDERFDYFSDFRWEMEMVLQIDAKTARFAGDTDVDQLNTILKKAMSQNCGLMAICD